MMRLTRSCSSTRAGRRTELLKAFQERVPHYMEPNRFVRVTSMPHNANGKIDRKRLKAEYAQHV